MASCTAVVLGSDEQVTGFETHELIRAPQPFRTAGMGGRASCGMLQWSQTDDNSSTTRQLIEERDRKIERLRDPEICHSRRQLNFRILRLRYLHLGSDKAWYCWLKGFWRVARKVIGWVGKKKWKTIGQKLMAAASSLLTGRARRSGHPLVSETSEATRGKKWIWLGQPPL